MGAGFWEKMLYTMSPMRFFNFLGRVLGHVGWRFFVLLMLVNISVKGVVHALIHQALLPYMKSLNQSSSSYQRIYALGESVWGCRGLLGAISDCLPLGGYHKRYYMVLSNLLGIAGLLLIACLPEAFAENHLWLVAVAQVLLCLQIATLEVMCSGKNSEMMVQNPVLKTDLVSFSFACASVGNLIGCALVGPIADAKGSRVVYFVALAFAIQPLLPLLCAFFPESRVKAGFRPKKTLSQHKGIFAMLLGLTVSVSGIVAITISAVYKAMIPYCLLIIVILIPASFVCLPRTMAKFNVFVFMWGVANVSISGALDFFYTAPPVCLPDGPNFSYTYYSTYTAFIGTFAEWVGIFLYQRFLSGWSFRCVFWFTAALRTLAGTFDYIMVKRLNLMIGIPDKVMYLFGDAVIQRMVKTLNYMPAVVLTSKLCPRGMEATTFAVMDGISHLGWNINKQIGAWATDFAGIKGSADVSGPCNFDQLDSLVLMANLVLPSLVVPLSFFLIPNITVSSDLPEAEGGRNTFNSPDDRSRRETMSTSSCSSRNANDVTRVASLEVAGPETLETQAPPAGQTVELDSSRSQRIV